MEKAQIKEQLKSVLRAVFDNIGLTAKNDKWITIKQNGEDGKGKHLLLKDGETPKEAIDRTYGNEDFEKGTKSTKKDEDRHQKVRDLEDKAYKEFKTMYDNYIDKDGMEGWGGIPASQMDKAVAKFNKKYKDEFDKLKSDRFVSFEDFAKRENKQSDTKEGSKDISKEEHAKIKEQVSKMSDDELVKAHFESQKGYESETPRAGSMTKYEATYGEVAQELKRRTGRGFSAASTESEIKEALSKAKSDSKGEKSNKYRSKFSDIQNLVGSITPGEQFFDSKIRTAEKHLKDKLEAWEKDYEKETKPAVKQMKKRNIEVVKDELEQLNKLKSGTKDGKEEKKSKEQNADNKATNSITEFLEKGVKMEQFIETFKNIFAAGYSAANEAKEKEEEKAENKCKNEEVDKRKLIDEVAGMMKSAGCSDEIIRTAIKDMEKESYDKSEAGTADNSKAKNEEEKADKEDKKADNAEEEKKEEEYKELKEKNEEEAMNKAKNEIFGEASANKSSYISREERLELGMKY